MIKKTAAIVVTYNRKELLLQNIEALLKQTVRNQLEIVIIDNASTDGTFEAIKRYVDKGEIIYINTGSNLGGAGGFQYGIRYAAEHDYEFVWVMDDDCIPRENTLEKFYEADQILKGDYGYLSSKVLWKDGTICSMNRQRKTVVQYNNDFISKYVPIKMASFVSLFIPVRIVKNIGLPIKEFFIWCDDLEYTLRIANSYPCFYAPNSIVCHKTATNYSPSIDKAPANMAWRFYYSIRNSCYIKRKQVNRIVFFFSVLNRDSREIGLKL